MDGGDEDPAAFEMRPHDGGKRGLSGGVERGRRLVEQPKRALGDKQAGKRHAPPLSGREQPRRKIDHMGQAKRRKRGELRRAGGIAAQHGGGEGEVLAGGQRGLHSVRVAEIMRLLADRALGVAAVQRKAAGFNRQEAGERSQQARFPRPVRARSRSAPSLAAASNESPDMTRRPPRSIVRSHALSRIASPFRARSGAEGGSARALRPSASLAQTSLKKRQPAIHRDGLAGDEARCR